MDKLSVYCTYEMMECIECNEIKIIHFETAKFNANPNHESSRFIF